MLANKASWCTLSYYTFLGAHADGKIQLSRKKTNAGLDASGAGGVMSW